MPVATALRLRIKHLEKCVDSCPRLALVIPELIRGTMQKKKELPDANSSNIRNCWEFAQYWSEWLTSSVVLRTEDESAWAVDRKQHGNATVRGVTDEAVVDVKTPADEGAVTHQRTKLALSDKDVGVEVRNTIGGLNFATNYGYEVGPARERDVRSRGGPNHRRPGVV